MENIQIATRREQDLISFLKLNDFKVEKVTESIIKVERLEELPVYISFNENNMYFEVDLGNIKSISSEELYFKLLDMNTEILPVSFGINNTNSADPRLVLVESREVTDLSDQELLAVFDALAIAVDKAEVLLSDYIK